MKKIPSLIRTRFKKDGKILMTPDSEMPKNTGIYLEKGNFIGGYGQQTFSLEEGTIIINGHYKRKDDTEFNKFGEEHYINSYDSGWSLTSTSDDSSFICVFYHDDVPIVNSEATIIPNALPEYPNEITDNPNYTNWSKHFPRVSQEECLTLSHVYKTSTSIDFVFPENYYLVTIKNNTLINDQSKAYKTWIQSSKNQLVNLKSNNGEETLVFLLV
jgi:hypothetical protein